MGYFAQRRAAQERRARLADISKRRSFVEYRLRDFESALKCGDPGRASSFVGRADLVPLLDEIGELKAIPGEAHVSPERVMLVRNTLAQAGGLIVIMSWELDRCRDVIVDPEGAVTVRFITDEEPGGDVGLFGHTGELAWMMQVCWTAHRDGIPAGLKFLRGEEDALREMAEDLGSRGFCEM
jgi:hypothetical protein